MNKRMAEYYSIFKTLLQVKSNGCWEKYLKLSTFQQFAIKTFTCWKWNIKHLSPTVPVPSCGQSFDIAIFKPLFRRKKG